MPRKLTEIETEMLEALELLGGYSLSDMQELADEAFCDLMEKPDPPMSLNQELSPIQREHVGRAAR